MQCNVFIAECVLFFLYIYIKWQKFAETLFEIR